MDCDEHIVGFGQERYEGGWLIFFRGSLPADETALCRYDADTVFEFCPLCGARILLSGDTK